jgi:hypothetical protein
VKPRTGVTWSQLSGMRAQQIHDKDLFPQVFLPLPHANHPELYAVKAAVLQPTRLRGHPIVQTVPVHPAKRIPGRFWALLGRDTRPGWLPAAFVPQ